MIQDRMEAIQPEKQAQRICRYCDKSEVRLLPRRGGRSTLQLVCLKSRHWPEIVDYDATCHKFVRAPGSDDDLGG